MFRRKEADPGGFWRDYEEKTGETVLARGLGRYISGWKEFDEKGWNSIWGLIIATSGGFRFHHFPHMNWLEAITRMGSGAEPPKEKTLFLPGERVLSAELVKETRWWKKIFFPVTPKLVIRYRDESGEECMMILESEYKSDGLAEKIINRGPGEDLPNTANPV